MDGKIAALRHWAKGRAREAASRITPARNSRRIAADILTYPPIMRSSVQKRGNGMIQCWHFRQTCSH